MEIWGAFYSENPSTIRAFSSTDKELGIVLPPPSLSKLGFCSRALSQTESQFLPTAMQYRCKGCKKTFATLQGVIAHGAAKRHRVSQTPRFKCHQCNKEFKDEHALDQVCH